MARVCDICGKRPITGWNPQSVGMNRKRALRRWIPNLQPMTLEQNGRTVARLWEVPYRVALDPADGREVTLRVVGLPKNLLGPWHAPGAPRRRAWMPMWYGAGVPTAPQPGARYDLLDLGLFQAPRWFTAAG